MERSNESVVAEWTKFYQDYFGLTVDLSGVKIPEYKESFDRIIIVAKGLTYSMVIKAMQKKFEVRTYEDDLDEAIDKNDRWPNEAYAIRVRNRIEADEELENLSADDLASCGIPGITFLERLLYELKCFFETGEHLDINNWTLCSGSRGSDGLVPSVGFRGGKVFVDWYRSSHAYSRLEARSVAV